MRHYIFLFGFVILALILHYWIRWPALYLPYFHNEDTAGIAYSADLILRGGLPYVDTVEIKAPGSFLTLAKWWSWFGRSLENAQLLMSMWSFLAACGMAIGSWFLYQSKKAAILSAFLYIYLAPFTDSIDINYGAWMIMPYIFSASILWWLARLIWRETKLQISSVKLQNSLFFTLGTMIAFTALMKRQGAAIFPLSLWIIYKYHPRKVSTLIYLMGGLLLGFTCFFVPYFQKGQLSIGLTHYFFSKSGWQYLSSNFVQTTATSHESLAKLPRLWDGVVGLPMHLPMSSILAVYVLVRIYCDKYRRRKELHEKDTKDLDQEQCFEGNLIGLLILFALLSFGGTALGFRFFKGYYLQLLPALIWLGVHPAIWHATIQDIKSFFTFKPKQRLRFNTILIFILVCTFPFALTSSWQNFNRARQMRSRPLYLPTWQIKEISQTIKNKSQQDDTIWVWGRWAWPTYYYTQLASATRYFKNLGVLTTQLSNTWNPKRKSTPTRFNPQSAWPEAINEVRKNKPLWIVCARNESRSKFTELSLLLKQKYRKVSYQELGVKTHPKRVLFDVYERK